MKKVMILQIKKDVDDRFDKLFEPYDRVIKRFGKINLDDYNVVYYGDIPKGSTLNDIFELFNLYHPDGYKGHSLSVSDLIVVDGGIFYVDRYSFKKVDFEARK